MSRLLLPSASSARMSVSRWVSEPAGRADPAIPRRGLGRRRLEQVLDHLRRQDVAAAGDRDLDRLLEVLGRRVLQHVAGRALGEGAADVVGVVERRQHDDRHVGPPGLQLVEQLEAVRVRHADVDECDLDVVRHQLERRGGVRGLDDLGLGEAVADDVAEPAPDERVVVDDQDLHEVPPGSRMGRRATTSVPPPGAGPMSRVPWASATRRRIIWRPRCPAAAGALARTPSRGPRR